MFSKSWWICAVPVAFCVLSCSVKEDRTACPCYYVAWLQDLEKDDFNVLQWRLDAEGFSETGACPTAMLPDSLVFAVPRGAVACRFAGTADGGFSFERGLTISEGNDCPELYGMTAMREAGGEECRDTVILGRQFANVYIFLKDAGEKVFALEVKGNVSGFDSGLKPVNGPFFYKLPHDNGGLLRLKVPRQTDSSLKLGLLREDGEERVFAIGNYIAESGYDWSVESLEDIFLEIDWSTSKINILDDCWRLTCSFSIRL